MWQAAFSAALIRPFRCAALECSHLYRRISGGGSDTAKITAPTQRPNLPQQLEQSLHQRAIRICNREPGAIARYMERHMSLSRGR